MMEHAKRFKYFAIGISFAIALSLTACSNEEADVTPPASETVQPSHSPSTEPPGAPEATAEPSKGAENTAGDPASAPDEVSQLISSIYKLSKEGKVAGSDYAAHTALFDEIEKKWGKADSNESAGKGIYATYEDRGITFGYNKGMIVFDVRSYADELQSITLKELEIALGSADEILANGTDDIFTYQVSEQYKLKFVIPKATGKVDHISVYSDADAKNNMAG
ncbi:hypothetical protein BK133_24795 [Paenibacillus sp. FSL H8-0548]|nr:hypothetical protein BK133_24795 [Paenibacillus sp. FSL H8-0548]